MSKRNEDRLRELLDSGTIALEPAELLHAAPAPLPGDLDWNRIEGMLLGLAIGDALGRPSEGLNPDARRDRFGEIRDYPPQPRLDGARVGLPSDDTQLTFWTVERMLEDGGVAPERAAERFQSGRIFGIGQSVRQFLANLHAGTPWYAAGAPSAGNGALMRIAPVLLPHLREPGPALWADTALLAMMTHNDPASTGSCIAYVRLLWELLRMEAAPEPEWWLETFISTLRPLEGETEYRTRTPHIDYQGPLWRFTEERVGLALEEKPRVAAACDRWYSGAYLLETVPSVLYILCRHGDEAEEAIIRAVNDTRDNDTVAAIVGAAVGALHGSGALPERWISGLLGRTVQDDNGRVFELIEASRDAWW